VWNLTQSYGCTPSEAWRELGRPPLSPRQLRRLTLAALDLASLERAWDDVTKTHGKGSSPQPENIQRVKAADEIYRAREQAVWDAIAEEIERVANG